MRTRTLGLFPFPVTHYGVNGPAVPRDVAMRWVRRVQGWLVTMTVTNAVLSGLSADGATQQIGYAGQVTGVCYSEFPDERPFPPNSSSICVMDRDSVTLSGSSSDDGPTGLLYYANTCLLWTLRTYPVGGVYPSPPMVSYDPSTGLYTPHIAFDLQVGLGGGSKQFLLVGAALNIPLETFDADLYITASKAWTGTIDGYPLSVPGYCAWGKFIASGKTWTLVSEPIVTITLTPLLYYPFASPGGSTPLYISSTGNPAVNPATGVPYTAEEIAATPLP